MKEKQYYISYSNYHFQITQISIEDSNDQQTDNTKHHQPSSSASHEPLAMPQLIQTTNRNQKVTEKEEI